MSACETDWPEQVASATEVLSGKWTVPILCALLAGPVRLSQLRRLIPTASKKALTANLRSLQKAKLISRRDLSKSVLHVEYEIAQSARAPLVAIVDQLSRFQNYLSDRASDKSVVPVTHQEIEHRSGVDRDDARNDVIGQRRSSPYQTG